MSGTPKTISASGRCFVFPITEGDAGMTTINCSRSFADSRLITTNGIKYKKTWILSKSLTTQCSTTENSCHVNHKSFKECPDKDDRGGTAQRVHTSDDNICYTRLKCAVCISWWKDHVNGVIGIRIKGTLKKFVITLLRDLILFLVVPNLQRVSTP